MVRSFIDEEFADYFFSFLLKVEPFSEDYRIIDKIKDHFLKTDLNFQSDIESMLKKFSDKDKEILIKIFFNQLTVGREDYKNNFKQTKPFNQLNKDKNIYKKIKWPFANFWLNGKTKYTIEEYENNNPFLFFTPEKIKHRHCFINVKDEWWVDRRNMDKGGKKTKKLLKKWEDLKVFKHNFFDIIINDRFCLKNEVDIRSNIPSLVINLSKNPRIIKNLMIFVRTGEVISNSLEKAYKILREEFDKLDVNNIQIKIFRSYKTHHDRWIITNSFFLESGNSFNYFDPSGYYSKNDSTKLKISDIANSDFIGEVLKKIQAVYFDKNAESFGEVNGDNILELLKNKI